MKRTGHGIALVAGGLALIATTSSPASAKAGAAVFNGTASIACFGCGASTGTAALKASGSVNGVTKTNQALNARYTVQEARGTCPATGSAIGSFTGAANGNFTWVRVGAVALITTTGDINGDGVAAFAVTKPAGLPCGGPVTATVVGAVG